MFTKQLQKKEVRVVIVDDHPVIILALKTLLGETDFEVVGEATDGFEAGHLIRQLEPDFAIVDINIPRMDGLHVIATIGSFKLKTKVLVLSSQKQQDLVRRCIQAGAAGFVDKEKSLTEIVTALEAIRNGFSYFPILNGTEFEQMAADDSTLIKSLTNRELMVFRMLVTGKTNKQIAEELILSEKTISTYKTRLQHKLGVDNLADLVKLAERNQMT